MTSHTDIIKEKLNILDVVGAYVKLEKAGKTWKGKSPFTNEKTPSFFVSPEKGFFYCFSSGKGGDIFSFIQEIERIDFQAALKLLAEKANVDLGNISFKDKSIDNRLFKLMDDATKWYEIHLRKNKDAVDYLIERGVKKETIIKFRIGFALNSWQDIYDYLIHKKYSDTEIEKAGLIIKKDKGGYYDRFRGRIMFPLFDERGRIVGFSGRIFNGDEKSAKYINSPEGPLFDKSKVLYGYHTAKSGISKKNACILVEGQFDVLMSQQAGFENTVAISGTGLTEDHINKIKRFTDTLILAFDSDSAGIKATRRSVILAYQYGMNVKVALLEKGQDPADTIAQNPSAWSVALADAKHYIDYRILNFNRENHSFDEKNELVQRDLFEFISFIKSAVIQDGFLQKISLFLGVSVDAVRKDFAIYIPSEIKLKENADLNTSTSRQNSTLSSKFEMQYLVSYAEQNNIEIPKYVFSTYQKLYESDILNDIKELDEIQKNMHYFIFDQKYQGNNLELKIKNTFDDLVYRLQKKKIEDEKNKIDLLIKKEQLKNSNILENKTLNKLTKESSILNTKLYELESNYKAS